MAARPAPVGLTDVEEARIAREQGRKAGLAGKKDAIQHRQIAEVRDPHAPIGSTGSVDVVTMPITPGDEHGVELRPLGDNSHLPSVARAMANLEREVVALSEEIEVLEKRLAPVLLPKGSVPKIGGLVDYPDKCPLSERIDAIALRFAELNAELGHLRCRCQTA